MQALTLAGLDNGTLYAFVLEARSEARPAPLRSKGTIYIIDTDSE